MHFYLQYIPYAKFKCIQQQQSAGLKESQSKSTKILLDTSNQVLLINPDCFVGIIREYIMNEVGIPIEERDDYDIINSKGRLLSIRSLVQSVSGMTIFQDRATYYVAYIGDNAVIPLLDRQSKAYMDAMGQKKLKGRERETSSVQGQTQRRTRTKSSS